MNIKVSECYSCAYTPVWTGMTGSRLQDQSSSFPDKHIKPHISADNSFQVDTRYRTFLGELLYISYFFVIRNFLKARNDH